MIFLSDLERMARLRLCRSETVGPITFYRLLKRFGSAQNALEALPQMALKGGRKKSLKIMDEAGAHKELEKLSQFGGRMIVFGDADYPYALAQIEDAPPVLNVIGDASLCNQDSVAIVGARNASANARRFTEKLVHDLGSQSYVITSGLARGIDTAAHHASLKTGTIAVLAGGMDEIYPKENADLYQDIVNNGCVISEMPLGTKPISHHFPRRNRIVSGLSKGVVVVEASIRSGSLITARFAAEQGRDVFAVPGFPGDPRAAGPNSLIRDGAKLVQNADDIVQDLTTFRHIESDPMLFDGISEPFTPFEFANDDNVQNNLQDTIVGHLSHTPIHVDELVRICTVSVGQLQTVLLDMELAGTVHRHPGNRVSKAA